MKITLNNHFHNTSVNLVVKDHEPGDVVEISASQYYRANNELCGMVECRCGGTYDDPNGPKGYSLSDDRNRWGDKTFFIHAPMD